MLGLYRAVRDVVDVNRADVIDQSCLVPEVHAATQVQDAIGAHFREQALDVGSAALAKVAEDLSDESVPGSLYGLGWRFGNLRLRPPWTGADRHFRF